MNVMKGLNSRKKDYGTSAEELGAQHIFDGLSWTLKQKIAKAINKTAVNKRSVGMNLVEPPRNQIMGIYLDQHRAPFRRVGVEALRAEGSEEEEEEKHEPELPKPKIIVPKGPNPFAEGKSPEEVKVKIGLYRLMYEFVKEGKTKVQNAETLAETHKDNPLFKAGSRVGVITAKNATMSDLQETVKKFFKVWKPSEHVNAYEEIANLAGDVKKLVEEILELEIPVEVPKY